MTASGQTHDRRRPRSGKPARIPGAVALPVKLQPRFGSPAHGDDAISSYLLGATRLPHGGAGGSQENIALIQKLPAQH
ncbi:hypothetical protein CR492_14620 [Methylocella silvestris]|uniref:Uncharacterized protein n=1 Tax=Methylocella silvestris TaxID=199596 RepID=A0A2J7TEL2_METSI|nr:hypothetical protein CR492_14620 [Methylocella silvestris]